MEVVVVVCLALRVMVGMEVGNFSLIENHSRTIQMQQAEVFIPNLSRCPIGLIPDLFLHVLIPVHIQSMDIMKNQNLYDPSNPAW